MAIECPATGCDYVGMVDQVAGHIGGRTDQLHDGIVPTVVRGGTAKVADDGIPSMLVVLAVIALGLAVTNYMIWNSGREIEDDQEANLGA